MTEEQFKQAKKIDNNIKVLKDRKSDLSRATSKVNRGEFDTNEILEIFKNYSELINFSIEKEEKEFKQL